MARVDEVDALLPQTQCGECGYPGCLPYAQALVQGTAAINQCPPGGVETVKVLGALLNKDPAPYLEEAQEKTRPPSLAVIREEECIGCTKCIKACPVDAIVGSAKLMHSVIPFECTGCGLCVEPCPVDCIEMATLEETQYQADRARTRFQAKQVRLLRDDQERQKNYREQRHLDKDANNHQEDIKAKQDYIQQALARVQAKRKS